MATTISPAVGRPAAAPAVGRTRVPAIRIWATAGALVLAFQAFVIVKWVTGPYFKAVPAGPTDPPTWMKVELIALQAIVIPIALIVLWRLVIRPWRREGHVGVDGVLAVAFISLSFQDPLSAYAQPWFTYNSWMLNFGSWVAEIPGMPAYHRPGAMINEPILFISALYVISLPIATLWGCYWMRRVAQWRPRTSAPMLVLAALVSLMVFDFVFEGLIMLPLGVFEYPGGHWAILFPDSWHKYPAQEMVTFAAIFTVTASLRYFRDDRGHTIVERGIDELKVSPRRKLGLRILAMTALVNLAMFCAYTVPNTLMSLSQPSWPKELQERSYLTDFVCGAQTDRLCPGPTTPIVRNTAPFVGADGRLVAAPETGELQEIVPFKREG